MLQPLPGPAKIAVIAFQVAVAQTNEGQRNFADLQKKYDPRREQLKTLSDEIDDLTKQLQADEAKLTPAEQQSRPPRSTSRRSSWIAMHRMHRTTSSRRCRMSTTPWPPRSMTCCSPMPSCTGYTLVLDVSQQQNPGALCDQRPPTSPKRSSTPTT